MRKNHILIFNSYSFLCIAIVLTFIIMLNVPIASAQLPGVKISKAQSGNDPHREQQRSISDLSDEADLIAVGRVTNLASEWDENRSSIRTVVTILPSETIKGTISGSSLSIIIPGGEIDGVGEWYSHSVQFQKDEDVVVFIKKDKKDHFIVADGERGKFTVLKDKTTGKKIIPNIGSLESFKTQIQHALNIKNKEKNN